MAQTLRNPWILSFVTGEKTPKGSPCVQVIRVCLQQKNLIPLTCMSRPSDPMSPPFLLSLQLKQNREQGQHQQHVHVGLISDRFHYCHALISDEALKRHR